MLQVVSATLIAPNILRITYSDMPLMTASGPNTARNRLSYVVTNGSQDVEIDSVKPTKADPFSVDVKLTSALMSGVWAVRVSNVQTVDGISLENNVANVTFSSLGSLGTPNPGAFAETAEDRLRKFLNQTLAGEEWDAYCAALGYSDRVTEDIAEAALNQNFFLRASGVYLERLTSGIGVERPANTGMSDGTLGQLAADINANKLTSVAMLNVLRAYYGQDSIRTALDAGFVEPYALADGQYLILDIDTTQVRIDFAADDFINITQALAHEISAVINRKLIANNIQGLATPEKISGTSDTTVRVYSGRLGQQGRVGVLGGSAQNYLNFPTRVATTVVAGTTWDLDTGSAPNRARLTFVSGVDPLLAAVEVDDLLNLFGTPFIANNRGVYKITAVTPTWVEFEKPALFTSQSGVVLVDSQDIVFWRVKYARLQGYFPNVVDDGDGRFFVVLPATTSAIDRTIETAWYLHGNDFQSITSATRDGDGLVSVTTSASHGLVIGDVVNLQDWHLDYTNTPLRSDGPMPFPVNYIYSAGILLNDGRVFVMGNSAVNNNVAYTFDPNTNTWNAAASPPANDILTFNGPNKFVLLSDGRVLTISDEVAGYFAIYDPVGDSWVASTDGTLAAGGIRKYSLGVLSDGMIIALHHTGGAFIYDQILNVWSLASGPLAGSFTPGGYRSTMVIDRDDRAYIVSDSTVTPSNLVMFERTSLTTGISQRLPLSFDGGPEGEIDPNAQLLLLDIGPRGSLFYLTQDQPGATFFRGVIYDLSARQGRDSQSYKFVTQNTFFTYLGNGASWQQLSDGRFLIYGGLQSTVERLGQIIDLYRGRIVPNVGDNAAQNFSMSPYSLLDTIDWGSQFVQTVRLQDNSILAFGGQVSGARWDSWARYYFDQQLSAGAMPSEARITGTPAANIFEFESPVHFISTWSSGSWAKTGSPYDYRSGHLIDPNGGVTILTPSTTTTASVSRGPSGGLLFVSDATQFPDEPGYLVLSYGFNNQVGPIKFLGTSGATSIRLEPGQAITAPQQVGATVTLLRDRGVFSPDPSKQYGVTWLTASSAGRIEAQADIEFIAAAGGGLNFQVLYPGDRGLGNEGRPDQGVTKLSDRVWVWGGDHIDAELAAAREDKI